MSSLAVWAAALTDTKRLDCADLSAVFSRTQSGVALRLPPHSKSWRKIRFGYRERLRLGVRWLRHRFHAPENSRCYDAGQEG
jgi:hypothetical protein